MLRLKSLDQHSALGMAVEHILVGFSDMSWTYVRCAGPYEGLIHFHIAVYLHSHVS
jgi:hypothetical protein